MIGKFRTSIKGSKHDSAKPMQVSIPPKDAIAIEPPKKVIKALYDWDGKNDPSMYLAFSAGDFLHVLSRENDTNWYEACNPLRNERGLVPVGFFETVGKTVRDSSSSAKSNTSGTHDSGYGGGATPPVNGAGAAPPQGMHNGATPAMGHRATPSMSKAGGLYGIVAYDFHAERPDELEAKEGEAIIVIAQSNPEWFVAKPITRLGGPGLIPVSFVEIRDMASGRAVEDPAAAVAKAGIPRVEEWKKMAAEYKNTSIPLGTVSSSQQMQSLQQGMTRMSVNSGPGPAYTHGRQPSGSLRAQQQQNLFSPARASVPRYLYADDKFQFIVECMMSNDTHWDLSRKYEDFYELQINLINAFPEEAGQVPGKPRILPYMPGPVKYVTDNISEGRRSNLDEYLRDLLKLAPHIVSSSLVRNFFAPREGDYELDPNAIDVNEHARAAPPGTRYSHSTQSQSMQSPSQPQTYQPTQPQHYQSSSQQMQQQPAHAYTQSRSSNDPYGHQRGQPSQSTNPYHQPHPSSDGSHPTADMTSADTTSTASFPIPPGANRAASTSSPAASLTSTAPVKVKAWFDRDTCVVIRMPPRGQFGYADLYRKIVERRRLEYKSHQSAQAPTSPEDPQQQQQQQPDDVDDPNHPDHEPRLDIEYRDETHGDYYRLEGDEDLDIAVERNDKLTLAVRAVSQPA